MREKHKERIILIWRERKEGGMEIGKKEGGKEAVEVNVLHGGLYEINKIIIII